MSYFWSELKRSDTSSPGFDAVYRRLAPRAARENITRRHASSELSSQVALYTEPKAIADVVLQAPDGSWLTLIGTPLVTLTSRDDEQRFLSDFLADPGRSARDEIPGNFAALAYDATQQRLIAATDFTNTIPVFFAKTETGVFVASHELALARALRAELDAFGVAQFVNLGWAWDAWTRFRGVRKLSACQLLVVNRDFETRTTDYWVPEDETVSTAGFEDEVEQWTGAVTTKVRQFFDASGSSSVVSDFTAGEDARLVLAACHALGLPLKAFVSGSEADLDVVVAKRAARAAGFDLIHRTRTPVTQEQMQEHALDVVAASDGHRDLFLSLTQFATDQSKPLDPSIPKFSGIPGGEAFRGAYYLKGKALRPDAIRRLDLPAFIRKKYLLDTAPGLARFDDGELRAAIREMTSRGLEQVRDFPIGTQIDHMIRAFQTVWWALKYRDPRYLPMATGPITRSMYWLPPRFKKGGRLTRASTEVMWPELAFVKTQLGAPTVRKTMSRQHLFLPEYGARTRKIVRGVNQRILKISTPKKFAYSFEMNADVLDILLRRPPFSGWFTGADTMVTGSAYDGAALNSVLAQSRAGTYNSLPVLGRVLSLELAARWAHEP